MIAKPRRETLKKKKRTLAEKSSIAKSPNPVVISWEFDRRLSREKENGACFIEGKMCGYVGNPLGHNYWIMLNILRPQSWRQSKQGISM